MNSISVRIAAGILLAGGIAVAHGDDEAFRSGLQPGTPAKPTFIPNTFQSWKVNGAKAGRFHSTACEHGLNPVVLIFAKDISADNPGMVGLLKKLNELTAKHPDARFGVCAIVLNDGGFREALNTEVKDFATVLAKATDAKDALEIKLKELVEKEKLESTIFYLDTPAGPKDYQLNPDAQTTIIFYFKHIVLNNWAFKDKMAEADVDKIYGAIEPAILEVERLSRPGTKKKARPRK